MISGSCSFIYIRVDDVLYFLITVLYEEHGTILKCALAVSRNKLPEEAAEYFMEPESRKALHALLPLHVRSCGPIVDVESIFWMGINIS